MREGIESKTIYKVKVETLHFQICPWAHCAEAWKNDNIGLVCNSPHVDFLQLYSRVGKKAFSRLSGTPYARMYEYWDKIGYGLGGRTPEYILRKAKSLIKLFNSIRKKGYNRKSRIQIVDKPLWITRGFHGGEHLQSPEIFHGHHRAACAYVLHIKRIPAYMCIDALPGTKKWVQKLKNIIRI